MTTHLDQLPEKGFGVLRDVPDVLIVMYSAVGYIKAQYVPGLPGVYQARLTSAGRKYRKEMA